MSMRGPLGLLLAAATLGGCAGLSDLLVPAPAMPSQRAPVIVEAEPTLPPAPPAPVAKEPEPAPTPPKPAPPATPTPPTPATPPKTAALPPQPSTPTPVLAPQASAEEEQRMKTQAERRIEGTERLVKKIDPSRLAREQQENYKTIKSFLVKAREALSSRDVQRAFTLADKAYLLADEMSKVPR